MIIVIVINFKNYLHGEKALNLAGRIERFLPKAIAAVSAVDLYNIAKNTKLEVYAQHVDFQDVGRNTGFVLPESTKSSGASGSLLNHSEHVLDFEVIKSTMKRAEENKLKIVLCVRDLKEARQMVKLKPYAMAFEDLKLIATGKSITSYDSEDVREFVKMLKGTGIIPLCGAGISSAEDVKEAYRLGCKGVIIASAIADSRNPEKLLKEISKI